MFNLVQNNKFRRKDVQITRAVNTYVFDTDIVWLNIYYNSPYYEGVKLWNDLPLKIRNIRDKSTFAYRVKSHFELTMSV